MMNCGVRNPECGMPVEKPPAPGCGSIRNRPSPAGNGFTLLEIMMVVAIIGLVMAMGMPAILRVAHRGPLRQAVNDVVEVCKHARAMAILHDETTYVVFRPQSVAYGGPVAPRPPPEAGGFPTDGAPPARDTASESASAPKGPAATLAPKTVKSAQFDSSVSVEMLDVNLRDCMKDESARVRFFPDGTSDELTLVLHSGDQWRKISLELTTALPSVRAIR